MTALPRTALIVALIVALLLPGWSPLAAQTQGAERVAIVGPLPASAMAPTLDTIAAAFPDVALSYRQLRSTQIAAAMRAHGRDRPDIAILSTPDIAVSLTNDGLAARLAPPGTGNWRGELHSLVNDPAVFVYRPDAFADIAPPRSRLGLAQFLEQYPQASFQRIGIVNIGIDSVAYALAAQDSLRSPLFWRLAQAFGATQARIYNSEQELLDALEAGEIDFGYNIALSSVVAQPRDPGHLRHLFPEDYVLSLPWTLLARRDDSRRVHLDIAAYLLGVEGAAISALDPLRESRDRPTANYQPVPLGPELLVFLDHIKRSRFLDAWFQMVTGS